jgi:hypothetical protein
VSSLSNLSYGACAGTSPQRFVFDKLYRVCGIFERALSYIIQRVEGFFPGRIRDTDKPGFSGKTNKESELFTERDPWAISSAAVRGKTSKHRRERVERKRGEAMDMGVSGGEIRGIYHPGQPRGRGA